MPPVFRLLALPILLLSVAGFSGCYAQNGEAARSGTAAGSDRSEAGLRLVPLTVQSGDQTHQFTVEVAETAQEQARGLMFRTELAPDRGMIFPFANDRMASFWMKNTVIPLDIIFIRRDGTVESIAANTIPYSLESVPSGEPVAAVLEIAGGRAAELGIKPDDVVSWPD